MATLAADEERIAAEELVQLSPHPSGGALNLHEEEGYEREGEGEGGDEKEGGKDRSRCHSMNRSLQSEGSLASMDPTITSCMPTTTAPLVGTGGISPGERFVCYMCYETHDTEEDALVAPCSCKGDTRYLHVQCLQKWYQASMTGAQTQVIRTTGNGAPACKICGAAYKTAFRRPNGQRASLLETESNGPFLSLVVVTKHDTNPDLFNTKFRLNFHGRGGGGVFDGENVITIGRSSSCNMILDYRTVSTIHARISYEDGQFLLSDRRSSNGTMVYLQDPLPLPYGLPVKLRMGRTTISLQARRGWTSALRSALGPTLSEGEEQASAVDLQGVLSQMRDEAVKEAEREDATNDSHNTLNESHNSLLGMGGTVGMGMGGTFVG
ncbi:hypothetical protein B484DRAFT_403536, partial [Ochromonadaceae sp. CCMP2298]